MGVTTKNFESYCIKNGIPIPTFFRNFKLLKENNLIESTTNKEHKIIWCVSEEGQKYMEEYVKEKIDPIRKQKTEKEEQEEKTEFKKIPANWFLLGKNKYKKGESLVRSYIIREIFLNIPHPFLDIQFKINQKKYSQWLKEEKKPPKEELY